MPPTAKCGQARPRDADVTLSDADAVVRTNGESSLSHPRVIEDQLQEVAAAYLGRFQGLSRALAKSDLMILPRWSAEHRARTAGGAADEAVLGLACQRRRRLISGGHRLRNPPDAHRRRRALDHPHTTGATPGRTTGRPAPGQRRQETEDLVAGAVIVVTDVDLRFRRLPMPPTGRPTSRCRRRSSKHPQLPRSALVTVGRPWRVVGLATGAATCQPGGSSPTSPSTDSRMRSTWPLWRAYSSIMLSKM